MADRLAAERVLQRAGVSFDHERLGIKVYADGMTAQVIEDMRGAGWQVQEIEASAVIFVPGESGVNFL